MTWLDCHSYNKGVADDKGRKKDRRVTMNIFYAKSILYAYPHLEGIMEQIDELVEKSAFSSMTDFSPAIFQCEKILDFTRQKDVLIKLKLAADKALTSFLSDEIDCFDYKYFKLKPKEYYEEFDFSSRAYFRKQIRIAKLFAERMEKAGINDGWYESNCLTVDFFKDLLVRVKEHELLCGKNKPAKDKVASVSERKRLNSNGREFGAA